jgi:NAD(P)-dependent dehydrogenase (short-subunit alcohol dehydrogenase family)
MTNHPALSEGRTAVITGAASGIGLAAAKRCADLGMRVVMADINQAELEKAVAEVARRAGRQGNVIGVATDVSKREEVERLKARALEAFEKVDFLMNNAGRGGAGRMFDPVDGWKAILDTNLWGVIHGVQVFAEDMAKQKSPGAVVNTGSKQGITCPPGNAAYNVSKAGVRVVTELLAHELRNIEGCQTTVHLLVPGFTYTGIAENRAPQKPAGAWTAEQVIDFMLPALAKGEFYIICPDNEVTRAIDNKRMRWAMDDIIENRPALSRWHPDFKEAFAKYMGS